MRAVFTALEYTETLEHIQGDLRGIERMMRESDGGEAIVTELVKTFQERKNSEIAALYHGMCEGTIIPFPRR